MALSNLFSMEADSTPHYSLFIPPKCSPSSKNAEIASCVFELLRLEFLFCFVFSFYNWLTYEDQTERKADWEVPGGCEVLEGLMEFLSLFSINTLLCSSFAACHSSQRSILLHFIHSETSISSALS